MPIKFYRYPVYPNEEAQEYLLKSVGSCRFVYNHFCKIQRERLENKERNVLSYSEMRKELTEVKQQHDWLRDTPDHALESALKDLSLAVAVVLKDKIHRESLSDEGKKEPETQPKELHFKKKGFDDSFTLPTIPEAEKAVQNQAAFRSPVLKV
jgi:putative transposase